MAGKVVNVCTYCCGVVVFTLVVFPFIGFCEGKFCSSLLNIHKNLSCGAVYGYFRLSINIIVLKDARNCSVLKSYDKHISLVYIA